MSCNIILLQYFKNVSNKKIEIQMLNACGEDVFVEQNKFKIS